MFSSHFEVKVSIYFRIHDSALHGGPGSEGYVSQSVFVLPDGTARLEDLTDSTAEKIKADVAKFCGVAPEQVEYISREIYERETREDDDDGEL